MTNEILIETKSTWNGHSPWLFKLYIFMLIYSVGMFVLGIVDEWDTFYQVVQCAVTGFWICMVFDEYPVYRERLIIQLLNEHFFDRHDWRQ